MGDSGAAGDSWSLTVVLSRSSVHRLLIHPSITFSALKTYVFKSIPSLQPHKIERCTFTLNKFKLYPVHDSKSIEAICHSRGLQPPLTLEIVIPNTSSAPAPATNGGSTASTSAPSTSSTASSSNKARGTGETSVTAEVTSLLESLGEKGGPSSTKASLSVSTSSSSELSKSAPQKNSKVQSPAKGHRRSFSDEDEDEARRELARSTGEASSMVESSALSRAHSDGNVKGHVTPKSSQTAEVSATSPTSPRSGGSATGGSGSGGVGGAKRTELKKPIPPPLKKKSRGQGIVDQIQTSRPLSIIKGTGDRGRERDREPEVREREAPPEIERSKSEIHLVSNKRPSTVIGEARARVRMIPAAFGIESRTQPSTSRPSGSGGTSGSNTLRGESVSRGGGSDSSSARDHSASSATVASVSLSFDAPPKKNPSREQAAQRLAELQKGGGGGGGGGQGHDLDLQKKVSDIEKRERDLKQREDKVRHVATVLMERRKALDKREAELKEKEEKQIKVAKELKKKEEKVKALLAKHKEMIRQNGRTERDEDGRESGIDGAGGEAPVWEPIDEGSSG